MHSNIMRPKVKTMDVKSSFTAVPKIKNFLSIAVQRWCDEQTLQSVVKLVRLGTDAPVNVHHREIQHIQE